MSRQFSFSRVPTISARRSSFSLSRKLPCSMNVGTLYPIGKPYEVYPGDTFKIRTKFVVRLTSAYLKPVMDDLYIEVYHFFVPHRLTYHLGTMGNVSSGATGYTIRDFAGVMGENRSTAWAPSVEVTMPALPAFTCSSGTVADYLEFPLGSNPAGLQAAPFRGFALIYDQWYRDQNNVDPMYVYCGYRAPTDSITNELAPNNNAWSQINYTGKLPKVTKSPDYFTRSLPAPQKGNAVDFLAGGAILPVTTYSASDLSIDVTGQSGVLWHKVSDNSLVTGGNDYKINSAGIGVAQSDTVSSAFAVAPSNLGADLSAAGLSINDFRVAIALQRMLEKDAIGGTRYKEILASHWGVRSPDARIDDTEFIGGHVQRLAVQQVPQTTGSGTQSMNTLGSLSAYSWTDGEDYITKGFVEHGYLFTCACIKQKHSYCQGIPRQYERVSRTDFYDPVFQNLGMLPVWKEQIYADGVSTIKQTVFGYQEAWDELRSEYNGAVGQARPNATVNFELYNFVDEYANAPTLNQSFVEETPAYVDRTLAVPSTTADQFLVDFFFDTTAYRALPVYSNASRVGASSGMCI